MWHKKETVQPLTGLHRTLHRNYFLMGRVQSACLFFLANFCQRGLTNASPWLIISHVRGIPDEKQSRIFVLTLRCNGARVNHLVAIGHDYARLSVCRRAKFARRFLFFHFVWRCVRISEKDLLINEEIREKEVRLVGADGAPLGIMSSKDALRLAIEQNLDLVMIAPKGQPPVCKLMDYGKYRFEQAKKLKDAKKKQKVVELKEIRLTLNIDVHDIETKIKHAQRFLKDGDKVKVSVRFKGREMAHAKMGEAVLERFKDMLGDAGVVEKPAKMEGRSLMMILAPKPVK